MISGSGGFLLVYLLAERWDDDSLGRMMFNIFSGGFE